MARVKLIVLISGRGSNLQSLIDACAEPGFPAEIALVISNVPGVQGLERAEKAGIETVVVNHKDYPNRESFEDALSAVIKPIKPTMICLAGFMRILTDGFVTRWHNRLINIHPSLLPSFKGLHTHERAIEAGVRFAGCTVHFVRPAMDDGPIIVQAAVPIHPDDTPRRRPRRPGSCRRTSDLPPRRAPDRRTSGSRRRRNGRRPRPHDAANGPHQSDRGVASRAGMGVRTQICYTSIVSGTP